MAPPVDPEENSRKIVPMDQIATFARSAGWTGADVVIATAVAMAESSGDRTAVGRAVPSRPDYGLWQVNYIHKDILQDGFFPPGVGWKGGLSNAYAAKKVWDSQKWGAWTVFKSGAYSKFLTDAQAAAAKNTPIGTIPEPDLGALGREGPGGVSNPESIPGVIEDKALAAIFGEWQPYLWIAGGALLVILGVVLLAKDVTPVGKIASIASKVAA